MDLFSFAKKTETYPDYITGCPRTRQVRKALVLERWYVSLENQEFIEATGKWLDGYGYITLSLTKHFHIGPEHIYYDGPHCFFSIGFLHLGWQPGWCNKCYPEESSCQRKT